MARHSGIFWAGITLVLSVVFAALFFPMVHERYTLTESLAYTILGVLVICGVSFARAALFSRALSREKPRPGNREIV